MNKDIKNKEINEKDANSSKTDESSFCDTGQRMQWFIASEVAGHGDFPTSPRWTREHLAKLSAEKEHLKRRRKGTKATEYHISLFTLETQQSLGAEGIEEIQEPKPNYGELSRYKDFTEEFALIPGYRIQVSAGHGSLNPDQLEPTRHLAFRRKWLKYRGFKEKDLAIVWAKGDSMEPTIHNNDTLVVNMERKKPSDGHIYIFRNGDELFVKRYQSMLGTWRLISDNSFYSDLDIPKEEQHQFEVVGQVVHIAKDLGD
ncbi:S24 family peptidase [Vibrio europaeus]|uniref:S24 family peptidase n=1 Tax=Vibrio europaeus TaxID=300876 RepID=UPI000AC759E4|nr:S24 family peptidase [Vibrio europaeus]MDC5843725.1 S24 family peptidase [Vibrio europaeus]MDC5860895.1 S24 family peptidase [Vibrio europaeus]MDC5866328.1 S24 family peptidase [Vibrio europaeus]